MPAWTLSDIVSNVTLALGKRSDIALSTVSFWANEAQRVVWDAMPHDKAETIAISSTTVNEDKMSLPTDFQEMLAISNMSTTPAQMLDEINLDNAMSWSTSTGQPTHYLMFADYIELRPIPDSSYSMEMRYRKQLSEMTDLSSEPSVSTRFRFAVFLKAKELVAKHAISSPDLALEAQQEYLSYMMSTPSDRALKQRENRFMGASLPRYRGKTPGSMSEQNTSYDFDTSDS